MKSKLLKIFSSISLVIFLLPLFTVSCGDEKIYISGVDLTFGKEVMGRHADGNFLMILLFLLPLALLVIVIKKLVAYETMAAIISGGTGLLLLIYAKSTIYDKAKQAYAEVDMSIGYYLMFLLNLAIIGVIIYDYWIMDKGERAPNIEQSERNNGNNHDLLESAKSFLRDCLDGNDSKATKNIGTEKVLDTLTENTSDKVSEPEEVKSTFQPVRYIDIECPLVILESEFIKVYQSGQITEAKVKIGLQNKTDQSIWAIEFKVRMLNYFDEEIPELSFSHIESQITMDEQKKAFVFIPISTEQLQHVGYVEVGISRLRYIDGGQWKTNERKAMITIDDQDLSLYRRYFGIDAICYAISNANNWLCVCGNQNLTDAKSCTLCGRQFDKVMLTKEEIEEKLQIEIPINASLAEIREIILSYKHKLSDEKFEKIMQEINSKLESIRFYGSGAVKEKLARDKIMSLLKE
ncbi:hypothetical protein [Cellulosilyticum sp. I15G10I2]|uniref:hypothetical protein n=1 Tax=Cellulosilyticum sp. I15G10I2 TaxID=1892843 RepID=UPI00085CDEB4|nr:hypothetical protein [Cellulosilyticum sp. I15G10I2]